MKCPFLTESLDVLQNLLSGDEAQSHDEVESVTTMESDEGIEDVAASQHGQHLSPPKSTGLHKRVYNNIIIMM